MFGYIFKTYVVLWAIIGFLLLFKSWIILIGFIFLCIDFWFVNYFWGDKIVKIRVECKKIVQYLINYWLTVATLIIGHDKFQIIKNFFHTHLSQLKQIFTKWYNYINIPLYIVIYILFCLMYWSFLHQYELCKGLLDKIITPGSKDTYWVWYYLNNMVYYIYKGFIVWFSSILWGVYRLDNFTLPILNIIDLVRVFCINLILVAPAPLYILIDVVGYMNKIKVEISLCIELYWYDLVNYEQLKLFLEQSLVHFYKILCTPPISVDYIVNLINEYSFIPLVKYRHWTSPTQYRLYVLHCIFDILGIFVKANLHILQFLLNSDTVFQTFQTLLHNKYDHLSHYWLDSETILSGVICQWFPIFWKLILLKINYLFMDVNDLLTRASVSYHINIFYNPFDGVEESFQWITFDDKWVSFSKICTYHRSNYIELNHHSMNFSSTFARINDLTHNTRTPFKN